MCGRFTLRSSANAIADQFQLSFLPDLQPRYNIAPTQSIAVVRLAPAASDAHEAANRELVMLHWGLIPSWAKDRKIGYSTINARAETVDSKPAFRQAYQKRRCLVLCDGYYEWQKIDAKQKQPYYIHRRDDQPFALAGLWEHWQRGDQALQSCTIIVTAANPLLQSIHDRMPVILERGDYDLWLDPEAKGTPQLRELLRPLAGDDLEAYRVSTVVNSPKNDLPQCIAPAT